MRRQITIGPDTRILRLGGRPTRATTILLGAQLGLFLLYVFADGPVWITELLATSAAQTFGQLRIWQPLTAVWLHIEPRGLLFHLLILWIFGSALERWWGPRRLVLYYAFTGALGLGLGVWVGAFAAPDAVLAGSGGSTIALLLANGVLFPRYLAQLRQIIGITVRTLTALLGGFLLLGTMMMAAWLDLAVEIGGGLCALLFLYPPRQLLARWRLRRAKRKFRVVRGTGGSDGPPGSGGYVN